MTDDPLLQPYSSSPNQWGLFAIRAPEAWQTSMGDASVIIGIADQGVDFGHPDLAANIWTNPDPGRCGLLGDLHGWDFVDDDSTVEDDPNVAPAMGIYDHGTHVAGIAAARVDNGIGIAGVAPRCQIMPLRINGNEPEHIAGAIDYALKNNVRVININGGYFPAFAGKHRDERYRDAMPFPDSAVEDAVSRAAERGLLVVCNTAGNTRRSQTGWLAAIPETLVVNPCNVAKQPSSFCPRCEFVDALAPGGERRPDCDTVVESEGVLSTHSGKYAALSGGCMATPHVSGVAALVVSLHPDWTPDQVRTVIRNTAQGVDWGPWGGHGVVDAAAAVSVREFESRLEIRPENLRVLRRSRTVAAAQETAYKAAFFCPPSDGCPVRLEVHVDNVGIDDVTDALAVFWDGSPHDGGLQVGHVRFDVRGRESNTVAVETALRPGRHRLAVLVDPHDACAGQLKQLGQRYLLTCSDVDVV